MKRKFSYKKFIFLTLLFNYILNYSFAFSNNLNKKNNFYNYKEIFEKPIRQNIQSYLISDIRWEKPEIYLDKETKNEVIWKKYNTSLPFEINTTEESYSLDNKQNVYSINSLNRSIVFNNKIIGPDISWLVPSGLKWNSRYKFDASLRGHNRRNSNQPFLGWNSGDAVAQFYYQPLRIKKYSLGLNMGMRSVYYGSKPGGSSRIGEGLSMGFRVDRKISTNAGISIGGEQLLHFDGLTDTGRDLYLTVTKGWWKNDENGIFPLNLGTIGVATGKLAEGNIKGFCSNFLGGSGTEINHQRSLCWAPVFSLARVHNKKHSTFFEYNSKWFLLGSSLAPFETIPVRGTFAIQISDHIDNYKINNPNEMKWVFRLSLGF